MRSFVSANPNQTTSSFTLEQLSSGESGHVTTIRVDEDLKKRFFALGLKEGSSVKVLRKAKFGGPIHLRVGTSELILRLKEASCICLASSLLAPV